MPARSTSRVLLVALPFVAVAAGVFGGAYWQAHRYRPTDWCFISERRVVIAAREIPAGTPVTPAMLKAAELPEVLLTDSYILVPDGEDDLSPVVPVGRRTLVPLRAGDPLLLTELGPAPRSAGQ